MESISEEGRNSISNSKIDKTFYGTQIEYGIEVSSLEKALQLLKDTKEEEKYKSLVEHSKSIFLGASSTSRVEKCIYNNSICILKKQPIFQHCSLDQELKQPHSKFTLLFEEKNSEYMIQTPLICLNRIKRIYIISETKEKIAKPFSCIISSYDS